MADALIISGRYDMEGGLHSPAADAFVRTLALPGTTHHNGGSLADLDAIIATSSNFDRVFWLADQENEQQCNRIKQENPSCILVTLKDNGIGAYDFPDLIAFALLTKSSLLLERTSEHRYSLFDPLGNAYTAAGADARVVARALQRRIAELRSFTRARSYRVADAVDPREDEEFINIVRQYAATFHDLICPAGEGSPRFFGNASFRCESGFPSRREGDLVYVSRRNLDKRGITPEGFVPVHSGIPVRYRGASKPSVDTPIQLLLYQHYPGIRYMLHGHVYADGAPMTRRIIPCGALEETEEVLRLFPDPGISNVTVNLRGHGSLVLAKDLEYLAGVRYIRRTVPEVHEEYARA